MARPRLGDSDSKRLQMVITESELAAIDQWQHEHRIASRSEAIRRLSQIAIRSEPALSSMFASITIACHFIQKAHERQEKFVNSINVESNDIQRTMFNGYINIFKDLIRVSHAIERVLSISNELIVQINPIMNEHDGLNINEAIDIANKFNLIAKDISSDLQKIHEDFEKWEAGE